MARTAPASRRLADPIARQILWNRLIAVTEEQATTMVRAAFSPPAREGGDLSAGVLTFRGGCLRKRSPARLGM